MSERAMGGGQGEGKADLPLNADNKDKLGLARHIEVALLLR